MDKEGVSACQWHTAHPAGAQVPAGRINDGAVGGGGVLHPPGEAHGLHLTLA